MTIYDCENNLRTAIDLTKLAIASRELRTKNGEPPYGIKFADDGTKEVLTKGIRLLEDIDAQEHTNKDNKSFNEAFSDMLGISDEDTLNKYKLLLKKISQETEVKKNLEISPGI